MTVVSSRPRVARPAASVISVCSGLRVRPSLGSHHEGQDWRGIVRRTRQAQTARRRASSRGSRCMPTRTTGRTPPSRSRSAASPPPGSVRVRANKERWRGRSETARSRTAPLPGLSRWRHQESAASRSDPKDVGEQFESGVVRQDVRASPTRASPRHSRRTPGPGSGPYKGTTRRPSTPPWRTASVQGRARASKPEPRDRPPEPDPPAFAGLLYRIADRRRERDRADRPATAGVPREIPTHAHLPGEPGLSAAADRHVARSRPRGRRAP